MRKIVSLVVVLVFAYLCTTPMAYAAKGEKKSLRKNKETEKVEPISDYKKLTGRDSLQNFDNLNVICKPDTYYLEIPIKLIGRKFLITNRLQQVPAELNRAGGNKGVNYQNQSINFEIDENFKKVVIRQNRLTPEVSKNDAVAESVYNNYINPILTKIKIEAISPDSSSVIIKVNELFNGSNNCLNDVFNAINLGASPKNDLSRVIDIKSFGTNLTATSELTTKISEGGLSVNITVVVSTTLTLLPETPMMAREETNRVGYFTTKLMRFSDKQQAVEHKRYITRWRLEPTDKEAYLKGELVEPVKPILFYVDPAMPQHLMPYIKQGILDWNSAFEKAGFKNAIQVKEYTDSIAAEGDDMKYSLLTHAASTMANAMGPSVIDPRSGEILEADIIWWHNVQSLLREWIMVQTSAVNPAARTMQLPDSLMGDAARFVACHEVGHSLGLRHNMRASAAYPVDSLRSESFTSRVGGTSSSIMDYARFNYIAQPEDDVKVLSPHIGPYDVMAIEWGYRWYPSEDEAKEKLSKFLSEHNCPLYRYSEAQPSRTAVDPRAMSEDLGDNAMEAARYSIANLKRIIPNVIEWTKTGEPSQTYDNAARFYFAIMSQWSMYHYHVLANIGGIYMECTTVGDGMETYKHVEKERQKDAVQFLLDELFTYPAWLFDAEIKKYSYFLRNTPLGVMEMNPHLNLRNQHNFILWDMLNSERIVRMFENEYANGDKAFSPIEMFDMLHNHIFATTIKGKNPDVMQRSVQKSFVDALITAAAECEGVKLNKKIYEDEALFNAHFGINHNISCSCNDENMHERGLTSAPRVLITTTNQVDRTSDVISLKRGELNRIMKLLKSKLNTSNQITKLHYEDIILRIQTALGLSK